MADTLITYLPQQKCQDFNEEIVTVIHVGILSDNKPVKLCSKCFKKRSKKYVKS